MSAGFLFFILLAELWIVAALQVVGEDTNNGGVAKGFLISNDEFQMSNIEVFDFIILHSSFDV